MPRIKNSPRKVEKMENEIICVAAVTRRYADFEWSATELLRVLEEIRSSAPQFADEYTAPMIFGCQSLAVIIAEEFPTGAVWWGFCPRCGRTEMQTTPEGRCPTCFAAEQDAAAQE